MANANGVSDLRWHCREGYDSAPPLKKAVPLNSRKVNELARLVINAANCEEVCSPLNHQYNSCKNIQKLNLLDKAHLNYENYSESFYNFTHEGNLTALNILINQILQRNPFFIRRLNIPELIYNCKNFECVQSLYDMALAYEAKKGLNPDTFGLNPDTFSKIFNSYLDQLLYYTDDFKKAYQQIEKIPRPRSNIVTCNIWIKHCTRKDDFSMAEQVLAKMKKNNIPMDKHTFSSLISLFKDNKLKLKEFIDEAKKKKLSLDDAALGMALFHYYQDRQDVDKQTNADEAYKFFRICNQNPEKGQECLEYLLNILFDGGYIDLALFIFDTNFEVLEELIEDQPLYDIHNSSVERAIISTLSILHKDLRERQLGEEGRKYTPRIYNLLTGIGWHSKENVPLYYKQTKIIEYLNKHWPFKIDFLFHKNKGIFAIRTYGEKRIEGALPNQNGADPQEKWPSSPQLASS